MRSILFSILFLFIPKLAISQVSANDRTVYIDSLGNETSRGNHKFYKIIKDYYSDQKEYKVYEYFNSNKIRKEYTLSGKDGGFYIGKEVNNYENGNIQNVTSYENGKRTKFLSYYENGNLKEEGEYNYSENWGKHYKINQHWDENNNQVIINGNGIYSGGDKEYYESGKYKNGFKDGVFEGKIFKDNSSFSEKYENGNFIHGTRTFADNTKTEYSAKERMATPIKGMKDLSTFIGRNFKYTEESIKNNISGKILIKFVIDEDGQMVEPNIQRGIGYGLDEEAIRVLLKYGNWLPAEQRGVKIKFTCVLPISLQSKM